MVVNNLQQDFFTTFHKQHLHNHIIQNISSFQTTGLFGFNERALGLVRTLILSTQSKDPRILDSQLPELFCLWAASVVVIMLSVSSHNPCRIIINFSLHDANNFSCKIFRPNTDLLQRSMLMKNSLSCFHLVKDHLSMPNILPTVVIPCLYI